MQCFAIKRYYMPNLPWDLGPRDRGFESRSPDQKRSSPYGEDLFCISGYGIRKGGTGPQTGVSKCPVDTCLARGRIPPTHHEVEWQSNPAAQCKSIPWENPADTPRSGMAVESRSPLQFPQPQNFYLKTIFPAVILYATTHKEDPP